MQRLIRKNSGLQIGQTSLTELAKNYGTPLYVYDRQSLTQNCQTLKSISKLKNLKLYYSAKANSSIELLKIIKDQGLYVDAMSPGEVHLEMLAGFTPEQILFVSNNVSTDIFEWVLNKSIRICVDSISQLESYLSLKPGLDAIIRINPGQGAGHHQKVITAGKVKFGIDIDQVERAFEVAKNKGARITGMMIHIGSAFLGDDLETYLTQIKFLLDLAEERPDVNYLDFGGGFGIPYNPETQDPFPFDEFSKRLDPMLESWMGKTGRKPTFAFEPGRFVVGNAGLCLTEVKSIKTNCGIDFVGTDLGFNFLLRPELYGAYHRIWHAQKDSKPEKKVQVVGNVCESGDYLGRDVPLPTSTKEGDLLAVLDTGAYGFSMASNYNSMPRPAEVLIDEDGRPRLIRKRESLEDLARNQLDLNLS